MHLTAACSRHRQGPATSCSEAAHLGGGTCRLTVAGPLTGSHNNKQAWQHICGGRGKLTWLQRSGAAGPPRSRRRHCGRRPRLRLQCQRINRAAHTASTVGTSDANLCNYSLVSWGPQVGVQMARQILQMAGSSGLLFDSGGPPCAVADAHGSCTMGTICCRVSSDLGS